MNDQDLTEICDLLRAITELLLDQANNRAHERALNQLRQANQAEHDRHSTRIYQTEQEIEKLRERLALLHVWKPAKHSSESVPEPNKDTTDGT